MLAGNRRKASSSEALASSYFPVASSALIFRCRQGSLQPLAAESLRRPVAAHSS